MWLHSRVGGGSLPTFQGEYYREQAISLIMSPFLSLSPLLWLFLSISHFLLLKIVSIESQRESSRKTLCSYLCVCALVGTIVICGCVVYVCVSVGECVWAHAYTMLILLRAISNHFRHFDILKSFLNL